MRRPLRQRQRRRRRPQIVQLAPNAVAVAKSTCNRRHCTAQTDRHTHTDKTNTQSTFCIQILPLPRPIRRQRPIKNQHITLWMGQRTTDHRCVFKVKKNNRYDVEFNQQNCGHVNEAPMRACECWRTDSSLVADTIRIFVVS